MLFHLTSEGDIRAIDEQHAGEVEGGSTFASEQELQKLATEWPMKRLVAIWNHLPGVQPVTRFTDRKTAVARIWRAIQPQTEADRPNARRNEPREILIRGRDHPYIDTASSRMRKLVYAPAIPFPEISASTIPTTPGPMFRKS